MKVIVFIGLASYTTYATQKVLLEEKKDTLINEATLLCEQTVFSYIHGTTSLEGLQAKLNEFENALK